MVELYKHFGIFMNTLRAFPVFFKIPACLYNSTMHSARFLFLFLVKNNNFARAFVIFSHFVVVLAVSTTLKDLFSRCADNVST